MLPEPPPEALTEVLVPALMPPKLTPALVEVEAPARPPPAQDDRAMATAVVAARGRMALSVI